MPAAGLSCTMSRVTVVEATDCWEHCNGTPDLCIEIAKRVFQRDAVVGRQTQARTRAACMEIAVLWLTLSP